MKPYIGMLVLYDTVTNLGGIDRRVTHPGIVYKLYEDEPGDHVGFTLFYDGIPSRYGKVPRSVKPGDGGWIELTKKEKT